ncbi:MAG TPA: hypothetical protein VF833_03380 [Gaiellaceae bacterium]
MIWHYVYVPRAVKLSALAALFVAGLLASAVIVSGGRAQVPTRTETTIETTTLPGTTETVEQTTTRRVIVPTSTTESGSDVNDTPTWVWVLLGVLALGVVVLLVVALSRRGGGGGVSVEERQRRLDGAVGSWVAQGWAVESQTADSAVLRRGGDLMLVSVDQGGHVSTKPMPAAPEA